jgi:hypothetical protein
MERFVKPTICKYAFVFLSLLPIVGCWALSDAMQTERFAKNKPEMKVMVGKWVPDSDTVQWMREKGNYPKVGTSLELAKDGTFQLINMPDWCYTEHGVSERQVFRASGKWEVVKNQDWWFLSLHSESGPSLNEFPIIEENDYWLWFFVGGPHGKAMVFEKKQ